MNAVITDNIKLLKSYDEAYVTIGNFDGLHLGHRKIIESMKKDARGAPAIAVTFEESTSLIVNPGRFKGYLFPDGYKKKALSQAGIDNIVSLDFKSVAGMEAHDFVKLFMDRIEKLHFYVGPDFRFGRGNLGNIHTLKSFEREGFFTLKVVEKLKCNLVTVSSSLIREKIIEGDLELAAGLLGRPYFISSRKIKGDGIGERTGYPTINLEINRQILPQAGVYFSLFYLEDRLYPAMTYIGTRPSMESHEMRNETNIIDFDGDPGKVMDGVNYTVLFIKKIRNEKKFHNLDDLQKNIYNDKSKVIKLYSEYKNAGKLPETGIFL